MKTPKGKKSAPKKAVKKTEAQVIREELVTLTRNIMGDRAKAEALREKLWEVEDKAVYAEKVGKCFGHELIHKPKSERSRWLSFVSRCQLTLAEKNRSLDESSSWGLVEARYTHRT